MAKDMPALPRRTLFRETKKADNGSASTRGKVKGELVGTRMQPDLLKRLDRARGDMTRPEKIRAVLDKGLP